MIIESKTLATFSLYPFAKYDTRLAKLAYNPLSILLVFHRDQLLERSYL